MSDDREKEAEAGAGSKIDQTKGRVKEAAGDLADNEGLKEQGQKEQQRGELKEDAAETAAEAEKEDAKADAKREEAQKKQEAADQREG
ncbi:MAG: CsbD family protein [Solirubrobacterales bacterium]